MKQYFTQAPIKIGGSIIASLLVVASIFYVNFQPNAAAASNQAGRVITIHDSQKKERVVISKSDTVEGVLQDANITLLPDDTVDPFPDTKLVSHAYQVNIYRARPVLVIDGNVHQVVMTPYDTPRQIIEKAQLPYYDEDIADLSRSDNLLDTGGVGETLTIKRATLVNLSLYGKPIQVRTQAKTVAGMIKEKKLRIANSDTVAIPQETLISPGLNIVIWREGIQTISQEVPIPFSTQTIQDANQPVGYRQVKTPGVAGRKTAVFEVDMRAGQEVARREIQSVQTLAPVNEVVVVGAKGTFSGSFSEALARLRSCEGSYTTNTGNGFYGAYQFDIQTWGGYQGYPHAAAAPPAVQDQKAWETYQRRGWQPWPSCSRSKGLQDIYR